jgi:Uma2 family endonuclease
MSNVLEQENAQSAWFVPPFKTGDRMSRDDFHRLYLQTPEQFRAELLYGEVFVASPIKTVHGDYHYMIVEIISDYRKATPGVLGSIASSVFLGDDHEVQPDIHLRLSPECGGRAQRTEDGYLEGAPELVIEVSLSPLSLDLGTKKNAYRENGALEYWVLNLRDQRFHAFDLTQDEELEQPEDGILRSLQFPGLWIESQDFFQRNDATVTAILQPGLASTEHAAFVELLASRRVLTSTTGS